MTDPQASGLTDPQLAAVIGLVMAVATGFGKLAWSMFSAWLKERAEDRAERKSDRDADRQERREDRAAMMSVVEKVSTGLTSLSERVSSLERVVDRNAERVERISNVHDVPELPLEPPPERTGHPRLRTATPAEGRPIDQPWVKGRGGG